jgi:hypothetical protein
MSEMPEATWVQTFVDRVRAESARPSKGERLPMSVELRTKLGDLKRRQAELDREMAAIGREWWAELVRPGAQLQIERAQAVLASLDKEGAT